MRIEVSKGSYGEDRILAACLMQGFKYRHAKREWWSVSSIQHVSRLTMHYRYLGHTVDFRYTELLET
jgi:hypothetical protein